MFNAPPIGSNSAMFNSERCCGTENPSVREIDASLHGVCLGSTPGEAPSPKCRNAIRRLYAVNLHLLERSLSGGDLTGFATTPSELTQGAL